ncbi:MAG TPA: DNA repair protein RecO [Candidatus Scatosoma pullicola]|nr:DNA repair protein RecO [Candidatus Scatosoma pullicola]
MEFKTDALVLRATDYGENDKLLTLFTPSRGKLTAGIRGVRKPKAKLSFAAQPFCFAEYVLAEKGGRYVVTNAYLYDGFFSLRTDIVRYYAACAVSETAEKLLVEDGESEGMFVAAAEALKNLSLTEGDAAEILLSFALSALRESGYMIDLDGCGICGGELGEKPYFDFAAGCFSCSACASGTRASRSTYELLRKCAGLSYAEEKAADGRKRALRLIRTYLAEKTEEAYPCFGEFIRLYE